MFYLNDDTNTEIGNPNIDGATVEAKLLDNVKDRTILIFHKRRRKHSRKKWLDKDIKNTNNKILAKNGKSLMKPN